MKKYFHNKKIKYIFSILIITSFLIVTGCEEDYSPSLFEQIPPPTEPPVINSVEPAQEALAGVTEITITGNNFSSTPYYNIVFFNGISAEILGVSPAKLVVKAPNLVSDSVIIKVSVVGSELFSNFYQYKLKPTIKEFYTKFQDFEIPHAIAVDTNSNIYVSLEGRGIKKITSNEEMKDYASKGAETFWNSLKFGSGLQLYAAKNLRGVWKITEGQTPPNSPWVATPTGSRIVDIDFDQNLNCWAVGNNNSIYKISTSGIIKEYPFKANIRSVRIFANNLYVAGLKDSIEGIWKFPIDSNFDLGNSELYFNYTNEIDNISQINAITVAADGDLIVGTNRDVDPILVIHPDGSNEILYPGVIIPYVDVFYWGNDKYLYYTQIDQTTNKGKTIYRIDMQKQGAPYYGRD
ncbi:MAG: hypothetical protein STSR0008_14440 [Ignavibacterium sp.]